MTNSIEPVPETATSVKSKRNIRSKQNKRATVSELLISLGAVSNLILAGLTYALLRENVAATEVNKRAIIEANRAWVVPVKVSIETKLKEGEAGTYFLQFKNIGRQPALEVSLEHALGAVRRQSLSEYWSVKGHDGLKCRNELSKGTLYPDEERRGLTFPLEKEYITPNMMRGLETIFVDGCFVYKTFNEVHHTAFCWIVDSRPGIDAQYWESALCDGGNYAD